MRIIFAFILFIMLSFAVLAAEERQIMVGNCKMNVISMQTSSEHANGLLGYTEDSFSYDAMLFDMKRDDKKYFHTMKMQMTIRLMGVREIAPDVFEVLGPVKKGPPGLRVIELHAPDVLEIPEGKYILRYKSCLGAAEE